MIYEYALDPEVITDWKSFSRLIDNFGFSKGRLIAQFPKKWKKEVYKAVKQNCKSFQDIKKIEDRLAKIDNRLIRKIRQYNPNINWFENAVEQHESIPFRAIISSSNLGTSEDVLIADDDNEENPLWKVETNKLVKRSAEALCEAVKPLLSNAEEVVFVDPHFRPEERRYRNTLKNFVRIASQTGNRITKLEYHVLERDDKPSFEAFEKACHNRLPEILPKGIELKIIRWRERGGGEAFHERYILTDKGGVCIGYGLDEGEDGQTTLVALLEANVYKEQKNNFQKHSKLELCTYKFDGETIVMGTATI